MENGFVESQDRFLMRSEWFDCVKWTMGSRKTAALLRSSEYRAMGLVVGESPETAGTNTFGHEFA